MDHGDDRPRYQGDGLDEYSEIEPTSDAVEDVQPSRKKDDERASATQGPNRSLEQAPPPDANDELGQHEGSYEEPGITTDMRDSFGTGGGDVGIGGDVSPHGAMHDVVASEAEVRQDDDLVGGSELSRQGMAERAEDFELVSDDLAAQGVDQAWVRDEGSGNDDPHSEFTDEDEPYVDVRDEDELDDVA